MRFMGLSLDLPAQGGCGGCGQNSGRLIQEEIRMHDSDDVELTMLVLVEGMSPSLSRTTSSPGKL